MTVIILIRKYEYWFPESDNKQIKENKMNTATLTANNGERTLWHLVVDLAYEGTNNDTDQEGVEKIRKAINGLIENGSGIKQAFIMRLPEKD